MSESKPGYGKDSDQASGQSSSVSKPDRRLDHGVAAAIVVLALAVSPASIKLLTSQPETSFRLDLICDTFMAFLLFVAGGLTASGRLRQVFFLLIALTFPLVLFVGLELTAGMLHLADRIALTEDPSTIKRGNDWREASHFAAPANGFTVYKPSSHGRGVTINSLGLRTAPPTPKSPGERRIAITGGSVAWGHLLADEDTIAAQLQTELRAKGYGNISVYNFGIEGATIVRELALLRHFKDVYGIDQVVFFTGGNDLFLEYFNMLDPHLGADNPGVDVAQAGMWISSLELYKAARRLLAVWPDASQAKLARFDAKQLERVAKENRLVQGMVAANDYCRAVALRCDFVLQPYLISRRSLIGTEVELGRSIKTLYPGMDALTARVYREAISVSDRVHDFSDVFDRSPEQVYVDSLHVNEAGNKIIADALLPIVAPAN